MYEGGDEKLKNYFAWPYRTDMNLHNKLIMYSFYSYIIIIYYYLDISMDDQSLFPAPSSVANEDLDEPVEGCTSSLVPQEHRVEGRAFSSPVPQEHWVVPGPSLKAVCYYLFCAIWKKLTPQVVVTRPMSDLSWMCQQNSTLIMRAHNRLVEEKSEVNIIHVHYFI